MTKQQLWEIYTTRNPSFLEDGFITLTKDGIKKLFDQTWDQGFQAGSEQTNQATPISNPMDELFRGFMRK
jgi:hypothetical protein